MMLSWQLFRTEPKTSRMERLVHGCQSVFRNFYRLKLTRLHALRTVGTRFRLLYIVGTAALMGNSGFMMCCVRKRIASERDITAGYRCVTNRISLDYGFCILVRSFCPVLLHTNRLRCHGGKNSSLHVDVVAYWHALEYAKRTTWR